MYRVAWLHISVILLSVVGIGSMVEKNCRKKMFCESFSFLAGLNGEVAV